MSGETAMTSDAFMETLFDINSDMLLDLHQEIKERYYMSGIMINSKSTDFIQCIMDSIVLSKNKSLTHTQPTPTVEE